MTKKLIWDDDVEEVDLGDGDYVTISSALTIKDMASIGVAESQMGVARSLLLRLVKSWRGPSFERDGQPVPCTGENIERLDMATANLLSGKLVSRVTSSGMDDVEKKESTESSSSILAIPGDQTT